MRIKETHRTDTLRRLVRILTLFCVCLLLAGVPASAARMGSVDINGSEVAYQALYKAYTEAASEDDAILCKFTVSNPTAGKNGALCRILLPQSQNVYLYMDAGDLAVMRYDGSEYKKFCADYQLQRGTTYTLCVFRDGLVLFDGIHCYTYSGNFYGFTDVVAGWSAESNVFSTTLTKQTSASESEPADDETDNEPAVTEQSIESTESTAAAVSPYPPLWVILVLVLGISSNLLALAALRSSNMALRTVRRVMPRTGRASRPAAQSRPSAKQSAPKRATQKRSAPSATRSAPSKKQSPAAPAPQPPAKPKQKPKIFFPPEEKPTPAAENPSPVQPYDLYTGTFWQTYAERFKPYRFGDPSRGYCTFVRGNSPASDLFVLSGDEFIWLNPVRFHTTSPQHGVRIRMAESAGIAMAFDFCHVNTGKREPALSQDVEMVNFRPARVFKGSHDAFELSERGIIVFETRA